MGYIPREDDDSFPTHSVDARKKWMRYAPCSIGCHSTQAAHCGLQAPARALKTYRVYIEGLHRKGDEASARLLKSIAKSKSAKDGCMFRGGFEHWAGVSVATHASGAPFYIDQKGPLAPPSKGTSAFWTPCLWYMCQSLVCEERQADLPYMWEVKNSFTLWPRVVVPAPESDIPLSRLRWKERLWP